MAFVPIATTRSVTGIRTAKLALWWLLASEVVIFGGLLASYIMHRIGHPEWAHQAVHTNVYAGGINTVILLSSSLTAVLAHRQAELKNGPAAAKLLIATIIGGGGFLCVKSVEWSNEILHGYTISANPFWAFYYTAAGIHACHVIAGMILMVWVALSAFKNEQLHRVELVGIYWHFVDLVWIFLFPLLYIAK
jgi:heme/copper-type cytochrome/quinol oxidase subunit 3